MSVDCAFDEKIAKELTNYLIKKGLNVNLHKSDISAPKINRYILELFLKETKRVNYSVIPTDFSSFLISKKTDVEKFGLSQCEICGFIAFEEELFSHRRTHGF